MTYSSTTSNTTGAMSALKMPPSTPPSEMIRKYSVSLDGCGRSAASRPWASRPAANRPMTWSAISTMTGTATIRSVVSAIPATTTANAAPARVGDTVIRLENAMMNVSR